MPDTITQWRADVDTQITDAVEEESITPDIHGALLDRIGALVAERLMSGGDTRGAILIAGTKDSFGFGLITNNLRRMTITSAGRVLIKTETESTFDLDVAGTGRFTGDVSVGSMISLGNSSSTAIKRNHDSGSGAMAGTHIGAISGGGGWSVYIHPGSGGWRMGFIESGMMVTDTQQTLSVLSQKVDKAIIHAKSVSRGSLLTPMTGLQAEAIAPGANEDMLLVSITNGNGAVITSRGFWYWDNTAATWRRFLT